MYSFPGPEPDAYERTCFFVFTTLFKRNPAFSFFGVRIEGSPAEKWVGGENAGLYVPGII